MQNRSQLTGSRENLNAQLNDDIQERDRAVARLKGLPGAHRPAATVAGEIAAAKRDRRWNATKGCTNALVASRDFCQGIDRLGAELGTAAMAAVLAEKVEKLNFSISRLRDQGAGQIADPQSFGFELMFGLTQNAVRTMLSILLALVVESVCCFGLLVIIGGQPGRQADAEVTLPEWVGKWLSERVEPKADAQVSFAMLEQDFRRWAPKSGGPRLSSRKFMHFLRAACSEVGLKVDGSTVRGLRLVAGTRLLSTE
jgi:hypothetical protein